MYIVVMYAGESLKESTQMPLLPVGRTEELGAEGKKLL